jgi:hypothetical protein
MTLSLFLNGHYGGRWEKGGVEELHPTGCGSSGASWVAITCKTSADVGTSGDSLKASVSTVSGVVLVDSVLMSSSCGASRRCLAGVRGVAATDLRKDQS